jgi:hypothetical protein
MWFLIARAPRPDAPQWPGRRIVAVFDALLWPACWSAAALHLPMRAGIVPAAVVAVSALAAVRRIHRAVWSNPRYAFTTWRFASWIAVLLVLGGMLKLWSFFAV